MPNKTFRRDRLLKLARDGRLVCIEGYNFDDQFGTDRSEKEIPVRVKERHDDFVHGWWNLTLQDFQSTSGSASQHEDGTVTLYVHSNRNMKFRILPEGQKATPKQESHEVKISDEYPPTPLPPAYRVGDRVKEFVEKAVQSHKEDNLKKAKVLFDQLTEASYMGMGFRLCLSENMLAMEAAQTLVDALKASGINITTPDWKPKE